MFEPNDEPFALDAGLRFLMTPADLELGPGDVVTFTALFEAEALEGPSPGPGPPPPPGPVKSTFDDGDEGWRVFGDAQGASAEPDHNPTGGNPGGYISAADDVTGGTWYWEAPAGFLGDQSEMGMLSFDLKQSATDRPFDNDDVVLEGGGTTLVFDTPNNPGTDWTHYDVPLEAGAGWLNEATGNPATQGEMVGVLSSLTALRIRGEYRTGADTGGLDNPELKPPPGLPPLPLVEVTVDDADAGFQVLGGAWSVATGADALFGNYHFLAPGTAGERVRWTPDLGASGPYDVYAHWTAAANRATNAPYTINHAGGSTVVRVDQQVNGGQFNPLGTFEFEFGVSGSVELSADADGFVIADAVRFSPKPAP